MKYKALREALSIGKTIQLNGTAVNGGYGETWNDCSEENLFIYDVSAYRIKPERKIKTNGTCEENTFNELFEKVSKRVNDFQIGNMIEPLDKYVELENKLKKKNEILKKARIKRKNQREELHRLNLKLQKCISFEEHNQIIEKLKAVIEYLESKVK